ncbi:hypothetical protein CC86DRAFT_462402 [Ophiobolus disseminans]|uniref:Uncharacterized protein n=1 Tax=Ophiobolus disseminans TaxID=1469910 RepID=A0A6A7AFG8_9PLEO|nr:hypothetical protein CC86DRAFT_462402 [Ophiobolus disseminans]
MPNAINEDISAMEESSRQPPVTSGLINIPQELRNLILHELWQSAPVIQLKQTSVVGTSVSITINYGPREYHVRQEDSIPGLPSWLLTSRVLLSGGLHQLYRHAIWEWYNDDYPHASRVGYNNPLAGVAMATNFEFYSYERLPACRAHRTLAVIQAAGIGFDPKD